MEAAKFELPFLVGAWIFCTPINREPTVNHTAYCAVSNVRQQEAGAGSWTFTFV
jgi:hypothetical protein